MLRMVSLVISICCSIAFHIISILWLADSLSALSCSIRIGISTSLGFLLLISLIFSSCLTSSSANLTLSNLFWSRIMLCCSCLSSSLISFFLNSDFLFLSMSRPFVSNNWIDSAIILLEWEENNHDQIYLTRYGLLLIREQCLDLFCSLSQIYGCFHLFVIVFQSCSQTQVILSLIWSQVWTDARIWLCFIVFLRLNS